MAGTLGHRPDAVSVDPGLYAVGHPTPESPVLVSANYKMSFDRLRSQLTGLTHGCLVLDTRGVNVWCSAGKGTFGTDEIVGRVRANRLGEIVSHRTLVVPQLGAPGVAAHQVKNRCGFRVVYGPVQGRGPSGVSGRRDEGNARDAESCAFPCSIALRSSPWNWSTGPSGCS